MSDNHDITAADAAPSASPGEMLRRERETQGLAQEDVAAALNLRQSVVAGIEEDNYEQVPIAAYRRGYLRAYARLLGMNDNQILEAYSARFGSHDSEHRVTPVQVTRPPSRIGALLFKLVTLLVIAGLIGLTVVWWQSRDGNQPPAVDESGPVSVETLDGTTTIEEAPHSDIVEAIPPVPLEGVDPLDTSAPQRGEVDSSGAEALMAQDVPSPAVNVTEPLDGTTDTAAVAEVEVEPEAETAEAATPADRNTLQLTFNEQSWTEIFDAANQRVFVGLQEPGTVATVEGEPPFRLTIGNATGVELRWGGEPVDLGAQAGANNVARFTLGE